MSGQTRASGIARHRLPVIRSSPCTLQSTRTGPSYGGPETKLARFFCDRAFARLRHMSRTRPKIVRAHSLIDSIRARARHRRSRGNRSSQDYWITGNRRFVATRDSAYLRRRRCKPPPICIAICRDTMMLGRIHHLRFVRHAYAATHRSLPLVTGALKHRQRDRERHRVRDPRCPIF